MSIVIVTSLNAGRWIMDDPYEMGGWDSTHMRHHHKSSLLATKQNKKKGKTKVTRSFHPTRSDENKRLDPAATCTESTLNSDVAHVHDDVGGANREGRRGYD